MIEKIRGIYFQQFYSEPRSIWEPSQTSRDGSNETRSQPLLLSILDAAAMLGVGRSEIYRMMAAGRLEAVKVGRRRLVVAQSVNDFVASLRQAT